MNVIRLGLAVLFVAGIAQAAEEFEIKAYSPATGIVEIKCASGFTSRPFSSFDTMEQQKIMDWLADKEFQSSFGLSITAEQQKKKGTTNSLAVTPNTAKKGVNGKTVEKMAGEVQDVSFVIKLENLSQVEFQNVGIEYRMFYETQEGSEKAKNCVHGMTAREKLLPREIWTFETSAVDIRAAQKEITSVEWKGKDILDSQNTSRSVSVKDRLKGLHLLVSKKGSNGETIEREYTVGSVPEKENWMDYQQQEKNQQTVVPSPEFKKPNPTEQVSKTEMGKSVVGRNWSKEELQHYIQNGNYGNYMSALVVAEYYYRQGDQKKTKQWADKVRTLVKSRPKEQQEEAAKRLAVLDQLGKVSDER